MKTLDMRGQPCPIPVVNAKKSLAEQGAAGGAETVMVLVDNIVAVQNLEKMARGTGCDFSYEAEGAAFKVSITKGASSVQFTEGLSVQAAAEAAAGAKDPARGPVVLITSDSMGRGAEELGKMLIKGFIFSLGQLEPPPEAVMFLNSGVRLTAEGAGTVPDLKVMEEKGTKVCTCGTCANYYETTKTLAVGNIVDMMAITNQLAKAAGVITI